MSRVGRDATSAFLLQGLSYVLGFAATIAAARLLGPELKGAVNLATATSGLAATLLAAGLGTAMTVGLRERWADDRMAPALWAYALACGVLAAAVFHLPGVPKLLGFGAFPRLLVPVAVAIAGLLANEFAAGVLQGKGRVRAGATARLTVGLLQSAVLLALLLAGTRDLTTYVWGLALAVWATAVGAWAVARPGPLGLPSAVTLRRAVDLGVRSQLIWILLLLNYRLDMVLLAALRGTGDVGVYAIAVSFSELAWLGVNALSAVLLPHLSAEAEEDRLRRVSIATRMSLAITAVVALAFIAALYVLAVPVFGAAFAGAAPSFLALSIGIVAFCPFKVIATYYVSVGRPGTPTWIAAGSLAVNVVANLLLIPRLGSVGAGLASSLSYTLASGLVVWSFLRRTGTGKRVLLVPQETDLGFITRLTRKAPAA